MMIVKHQSLIVILTLLWAACGSDKSISDRVALSEVTYHLESNPVFETAEMEYGEVKFDQKSDADLLATYKELEKGGYVTLELLKERKRFLAKDSTFVYLVKLTNKSIPFVLEKTDKKATVKTVEYTLDEDGGIAVEQTGKNRAKATVTLKKTETDFVDFAKKGADNNASFTKKTYTLRFNKETGWGVTK
ncbi:hypothetical protein JHJ32_17220 [Parapedobacter sp. ISTM3]|uniref:Lipoprotein n=1 Tax=Parapedobacter luteus TaxID=623280 RepID=A0A1T5AJK9_9SPHI|nr:MULTISPECIES: hypothetical protein [Parapedobacter]MBK1441743.1 hypothetical protein [Parapedobacter sp. ISTM3]SKB35184.1 hypothetical protein SAMN05660226_00826 [Parapedobacter luteus]